MRFSEEQIIGILKEAETAGNARAVCREHSITEQTFVKLYPGAHVIIWACGPNTSPPETQATEVAVGDSRPPSRPETPATPTDLCPQS